jgi:hypothetical protein
VAIEGIRAVSREPLPPKQRNAIEVCGFTHDSQRLPDGIVEVRIEEEVAARLGHGDEESLDVFVFRDLPEHQVNPITKRQELLEEFSAF